MAQRRVTGQLELQVRHAEGNVPRLVLGGEPRNLPSDRVGPVGLEEAQQIEETALAKDRQQERGEGEIGLVDECLERRLSTGRGEPEPAALEQRASGEYLDVPRLVGHLNREDLYHFLEVRVDLAEEARRHEQRGVLVLDQVCHELYDRVLHLGRQVERCVPVDGRVGIPLRSGGLCVKASGLVRPDFGLHGEGEMKLGRSRLDRGPARGQAPGSFRVVDDRSLLARRSFARLFGAAPAAGLGAAADHPCDNGRGSRLELVALGAAPGGQMNEEVGRLTADAETTADRELPQRPLDQEMGESQIVNIDNRRR